MSFGRRADAVTPPLYGAQQTSPTVTTRATSGGERGKAGAMGTDHEHTKALEMALAQVEKQYGKGAIMRMGEKTTMNIEAIPTGALVARPRPRRRRAAPGAGHRDLRAGVVGQVDAGDARRRRGATQRRGVRLHRRRARHGPDLRQGDRRRHRPVADLPARHRRAGAGDRRHARALGRPRRRRHRLRGGADPTGRDRGRDGRQPRRPAGPPDEPGAAQAHRQPQQDRRRSWSSSTNCARRSA